MNLYLDTSSLFKLYVEEEGSEDIAKMSRAADAISISRVGYAELRGSLARAQRAHRLTAAAYRDAVELFNGKWSTYAVREVTEPLVRLAGDLAAKHFLRGFDAIHLASAVTIQQELGEPITFSASDDRLMEAAEAEGLATAGS